MEKKLLLLMLLVLLSGLVFSQGNYPKVVVVGQDTTVIFSREQVKELALTKLRHDMYKSMSDSCFNNALILERKVLIQEQMLKNLELQIVLKDSILVDTKKISEITIQQKDDEIKQLRVQKWICIGVAILTTCFAIWK